MANTVIQLKYSTVTASPTSLNVGEPGYSYTSNTLFIGTPDSLSAIAIGGKFYVDQQQIIFDKANTNATIAQGGYDQANTATTIASGAFGQANAAFDKANTNATLGQSAYDQANTATTIAQGGYDQANTATTLAQGGYDQANTATTIAQGAFDTANNKFDTTGGTISGDVTITGNLSISGNTITVDSEVLRVNDSIILLANNNIGDTVDIGFTAHYGPTSDEHTGLVRHSADGKWYLFENYDDHFIHGTNTINIADPSFVTSNLVANLQAPTEVLIKNFNILDRTNAAFTLANTNAIIAQGGYDQANTATTIATGAFQQANAGFDTANSATNTAQAAFDLANGTAGIANTDVTNISITGADYGTASTVAAFRVEANGRISSANSTSIAIAASQITSGTLGVERGGTGATTLTTNGVLLGQGTSAISTVSSSTEGHVLTINDSGVPTFTMLSGGTF